MPTFLLLLLLGAEPAAADTVVVCPAAFRQAMQPWAEYRTRQGHALRFVSNTGSPEEIRREIRETAKRGRLRFVVLVGDAEPAMYTDPALRARCVPPHYAKAKVNVMWHSPPHIATDNWYADLDDDGSPDMAIGRLTADSPQELGQIVAKTLAYERSTDVGPWRRQLNFVAGIGGFGFLADAVLESAARYFLTQNIPAAYRVSMTYGSWRSPYCPAPRSFRDETIERLNEGALFWVYIGHGQHLSVDRLRVPDGEYPIFESSDAPKLACRHAAPIAVFLACYTGAVDATSDCLAEQMLRQPGGPVAVLAGSRVTMPYAMSVMSINLLDEVFNQRRGTIGEAVLHAKQRMLKEPADGDRQRTMLDAIAGAISPAPKMLAEERAEHVLMFNLVGDPLLRIRYPQPIALDVPAKAAAGGPLKITGTCPVDGRGTVELAVERGRLTFRPPPRGEYPKTAAGFAEFQETYGKANDQRLVSVPVEVSGGRFAVQLDVPAEAAGACHVCAFVEGNRDFALGSADVKIEAKKDKQAPP